MKQYQFVNQFQCLGGECEDTCCKGWGMQVDKAHVALYETEAPEILKDVVAGEAEHVMRRDPETDYCVRFGADGWCTIHKERGDGFLGDACHFYPRITRAMGDITTMAATPSCPEVVRLGLSEADAFSRVDVELDRTPESLTNYLPEGLSADDGLTIIDQLVAMVLDDAKTAEQSAACLVFMLQSLQGRGEDQWPMAVKMYSGMALNMLPAAAPSAMDSYTLLQTLRGLMFASRKSNRPRLEAVFESMEAATGIAIDREKLEILQTVGRENARAELEQTYVDSEDYAAVQTWLKRWLAMQIVAAGLPFSGFGRDLNEKATILAVRFATVRLALLSQMVVGELNEAEAVRIIQSLARFMDHLADPELSMNFYKDAGWLELNRLVGLVHCQK